MTVCIAAIADNGKKIVAVSDKMLSIAAPMAYQYESEDVTKIYNLATDIVAMVAGTTNLGHDMVQRAKIQLGDQQVTVIQVAEALRDGYHSLRAELLADAVLKPHGLTLEEYKDRQASLHSDVVSGIERSITEYNLGVSILVAGVDATGAHLMTIDNPGVIFSGDGAGYLCIGIGAPHALYSLIDSGYSKLKSIEEVESMVATAKQHSEMAPGVGKLTEKKVLPNVPRK